MGKRGLYHLVAFNVSANVREFRNLSDKPLCGVLMYARFYIILQGFYRDFMKILKGLSMDCLWIVYGYSWVFYVLAHVRGYSGVMLF